MIHWTSEYALFSESKHTYVQRISDTGTLLMNDKACKAMKFESESEADAICKEVNRTHNNKLTVCVIGLRPVSKKKYKSTEGR